MEYFILTDAMNPESGQSHGLIDHIAYHIAYPIYDIGEQQTRLKHLFCVEAH